MAVPLNLTLAIERYDRHFPFFDNTLQLPEGLNLTVYQTGQSAPLRDGKGRHERMLHGGDFDVAEFSLSTFLMARARGLPIVGIPVFPRRLFSLSQMWVHPDSGLHHPRDLIGKKVAISSFQTTLSLLAKGDLKFQYDTPWEKIHWLLTTKEKVQFDFKPGVQVDYIGGSREDVAQKLANHEIDAFFLPHPPHSVVSGKLPARRLIDDCRAAEIDYFRRVGDFPIMHVIAIRQELIQQEPWLGRALYDLFNQAKSLAEEYYEDPGWSRLAWGRHYYEQEKALFGTDPWENGFQRNRANLERFIHYSQDQGMIDSIYPPEELFVENTLNT
ncbi:MAG: ABC transporter substrate-binding protein [Marinobacter sp.]|uniref:ABC transporter substrate-binding protein n=1 Tax=Marinobacter sp. TaxID=50741 RepID=UPI00349FED9C